jgi:hypothetical protein
VSVCTEEKSIEKEGDMGIKKKTGARACGAGSSGML